MPVTDVKITEVMYNPAGFADSTHEFIEITNTGTDTFNISNWQIGNSDFLPESFFDSSGGAIFLAPGQSAVIVPAGTTQASFEALYGPLPANTVFINVSPFSPNGGTLDLSDFGQPITLISGSDGPADSIAYPDIAEGTAGAELSVGITRDALGDPVYTSQSPDPGTTAAVMPPAAPTNGDDTLVGTSGDDNVDLLDGRDSYEGGAGNDIIFGSHGNDQIDGGADDDDIDLGNGNDHGWGGEGNDTVSGGSGADQVNGNSGDDTLFGGKGGDTLRGGKGEDFIDGGRQSDEIHGGEQADEIYGGYGSDLIYGDEGLDQIYGGSGGDEIYGGTMDDDIFGGHGADQLFGDDGEDFISGGASNDRIYGGEGRDVLEGDSGNDRLYGGSENDILVGGAGADWLNGGNGDDELEGGLADDRLTGNSGADTFVFTGVVNHDRITDFGNEADVIYLGAEMGFADAQAVLDSAVDVAGSAVIDLGQWGSITLDGVAAADLTLDDFFVEEAPLIVG